MPHVFGKPIDYDEWIARDDQFTGAGDAASARAFGKTHQLIALRFNGVIDSYGRHERHAWHHVASRGGLLGRSLVGKDEVVGFDLAAHRAFPTATIELEGDRAIARLVRMPAVATGYSKMLLIIC